MCGFSLTKSHYVVRDCIWAFDEARAKNLSTVQS